MIPTYLPPERPFTPEVRARLRTRILRGTEKRSVLAPLAAAAAVVLVVVMSLLVTRVDRETRVVPADRPELPIPGYTTQQLAGITRQCKVSLEALGPAGVKAYDGMRLHNVQQDVAGTTALFYGPHGSMVCTSRPRAASTTLYARLIGFESSYSLGRPLHEDGGFIGWPEAGSVGYRQSAGRVEAGIVRVEIRVGGNSTQVPVVNGTYIATVFTSSNPEKYQVVGYRADGSVVPNAARAGIRWP